MIWWIIGAFALGLLVGFIIGATRNDNINIGFVNKITQTYSDYDELTKDDNDQYKEN